MGARAKVASHAALSMLLKSARIVVASGMGAAFAGCSGLSSPAPLSLSLPTVPSVGSIASTSAPEIPLGSATEVYSRVGRGAMACWFGAKGPLKENFIYHADADPASRGGKAEIVIHVRDPGQPNPRGSKAYRIHIVPAGESSTLTTENLKMPEDAAKFMSDDVNRWSRGDTACTGSQPAAGWSPKDPGSEEPSKPASLRKGKSNSAATSRS